MSLSTPSGHYCPREVGVSQQMVRTSVTTSTCAVGKRLYQNTTLLAPVTECMLYGDSARRCWKVAIAPLAEGKSEKHILKSSFCVP